MNLLTWIFRRRSIDRDLDAEIRQHFQMAIADRIAGGEDPEVGAAGRDQGIRQRAAGPGRRAPGVARRRGGGR